MDSPPAWAIRAELPSDEVAIRGVVYAAFLNHPQHAPGAEPVEQAIVDRLRNTGALTLSLVAEGAGEVIGHIAFSRVRIDGEDVRWYGLGPLAVRPDQQGAGVGSALVREGIARLRAQGAGGVVLVGEPEYYARFGFRQHARLTIAGLPPEYFLVLPFGDAVPEGAVTFDPAFAETAEPGGASA
jgi:putative acetyltransferase